MPTSNVSIGRASGANKRAPSCSIISMSLAVHRECYIETAVVLAPCSRLGFGVSIKRSASIGHHDEIGSYATVSPGAHIEDHRRIGKKATIGMGATVLDHIQIGNVSVIGGGSVVTKDVPAGVVAYGNPCRVVRDN